MRKLFELTVVLSLALSANMAQAECVNVRSSVAESGIPSPNDPIARTLGIVTGDLAGVSTASITSATPDGKSTSSDVILTKRGDTLIATGATAMTPGDKPGEFSGRTVLTIIAGSGIYEGATGTIIFDTRVYNLGTPNVAPTFDVVYRGSVCGAKIRQN